jgi:4-hydroxybenzoate polyprenyltransferase
VAYDTYYAMADRADDLKIGVKSSAILFGRHDRRVIAALQVLALLLLAGLGAADGRGALYFAGLLIAAGFAVRQWHMTRTREPAACFAAFLDNNRFGLAVFAGLALDHAWPLLASVPGPAA